MAHLQALPSRSPSSRVEILSNLLELIEAFKAFDGDDDGLITEAELRGVIGSLGCNASEQEVREIMRHADTDGDGLLSMDEFLEMNTKEMEVGNLAGLLKAAFEALDLDGNGVVSAEELYQVVGSLGEGITLEECNELIASIDGDGDGMVSFDEFKIVVNALI